MGTFFKGILKHMKSSIDFEIVNDLRTYSFYWDFIEKIGFQENIPLHRLCSLMRKMGVKSYILENKNKFGEDISLELFDLDRSFDCKGKASVRTVSFFNSVIKEDNLSSLDKWSCLSTATLIEYRNKKIKNRNKTIRYVFEALVTFPKLPIRGGSVLLNNYIHCGRHYKKKIMGQLVSIMGTYFCQQNSITSVCAHSALKMIVNSYIPHRISNLDLLTSTRINSVLRKGFGLTDPSKGFCYEELEAVLKDYGLSTTVGDFFQVPKLDYKHYLHSVIEGRPALIKFVTKNDFHVIPVIGHTLNSDEWHPEAQFGYWDNLFNMNPYKSNIDVPFNYMPCSHWVDHFIIHDDNFGMYYCMNSNALHKTTIPQYDPEMRAHSVIGIYSQDINYSPAILQEWAAPIISDVILNVYKDKVGGKWGNRLFRICSGELKQEILLLRTILVTKENYLEHLASIKDHDGNHISNKCLQHANSLPKVFWMTEYTIPNLYSGNKAKLGEAIFLDTPTGEDFPPLIFFRGPETFLIRDSNDSTDDYIFVDGEKVISHTPLYRCSMISETQEW